MNRWAIVAIIVVSVALFETVLPLVKRKLRDIGRENRRARGSGGERQTPPPAQGGDGGPSERRPLPAASAAATDMASAATETTTETETGGDETAPLPEDEAERKWMIARNLPHSFIPDFDDDERYLTLLIESALLGHVPAMVKLGDYAYRRGTLVEAYYWTVLARMSGETGVDDALSLMLRQWEEEEFPEEYENVYEGFSEVQGVFARAAMKIACGYDTEAAEARMAELAAAGFPEAVRFGLVRRELPERRGGQAGDFMD